MAESTDEKRQVFDPDADRYPSLGRVLMLLPEQEDFPEGPVERIEIRCQASGEATCLVWTPRADEPWGGYIPPA